MTDYSIREVERKLQEHRLPPLAVVCLDPTFPSSIWNISNKYGKFEVDTYLQYHKQYTSFRIPLSCLFDCQIVRLNVAEQVTITTLINNKDYIFKLDGIFGLHNGGILMSLDRVFDRVHVITKLMSYKEETCIDVDKVTKLQMENKQITLSFCLVSTVGKNNMGVLEDKLLVTDFTGGINVYLDTE
jgi:hypothetical protein